MKISVLTSAYNAESTLARTIESVLNQSYENFEYIVIDHGSTDGTGRIIDDYVKKDSRLSKLALSDNPGYIGNALNQGLKYANGEYICILDADDTYNPLFLELMYENITKTNSDIAISGFVLRSGKNEIFSSVLKNERVITSKEDYVEFFQNDFHMAKDIWIINFWWNKLYKKSYICATEEVFGKERHIADAIANLNMLMRQPRVVFVKYIGVNYTCFTETTASRKCENQQYIEYLKYAEVFLRVLKKYKYTKERYSELVEVTPQHFHYLQLLAIKDSAEVVLDNLEAWAFSSTIKEWIDISEMHCKQLKEVELFLKINRGKYGDIKVQERNKLGTYYNLSETELSTEGFNWCKNYMFEEENWFSLSAQSIVESIIS